MRILARLCILCFISFFSHSIYAADEPIDGAPSLSIDSTENSAVDIEEEEAPVPNILSSSTPKASVEEESITPDLATPVENELNQEPVKEDAEVVDTQSLKEENTEEKVLPKEEEKSEGEIAKTEESIPQSPKAANDLPQNQPQPKNDAKENNVESTDKDIKKEEVKPTNEVATSDNSAVDVPTEPLAQQEDQTSSTTQTPVLDALRRKQQKTADRFYTSEYLTNMYIPYFYSVYELPQKLSPYLLLRAVKAAPNSSSLIYEIGVADSIGPLDLDGTPEDNKVIKLFCQITLNDAVLHRLEDVELEFYHGERDFFSKKLTFLNCTGGESYLVEKKLLSREKIRLDNEFVFAYEEQKDAILSEDYLKTKFIPYALERIEEKFLPVEKNPKMFLEDGNVVVISFDIDSKDDIKKASYTTDRISRTCEIATYSRYLLPRIIALKYRYLDTKGEVIREIVISNETCDAINAQRSID